MDKRTNEKSVGIGEIKVGRGDVVLAAYGVGSCVVIMVYDSQTKVGGLAHCLLPYDDKGSLKTPQGAVSSIVEEMLSQGAQKDRMTAKIVGGAKMFEEFESHAIGYRNVIESREELQKQGIPIMAEDVFGNYGRSVSFNLENGQVTVRSYRHGEKIL